VVPLPDVPCVRVRTIFNEGAPGEGGNRFYIWYAGSAPTGANCTTLAGDVAAAWGTNIAPLVNEDYALEEVDVLDIATDTGLSGQWEGTTGGSRAGTQVPQPCATNVEFGIARRYRGGKPRMFLPPPVTSDLADQTSWNTAFIDAVNAGVLAFFEEIEALSIGAMGALTHVNLSYYQGFHNITNSSGRERAVPTYRAVALHNTITSYICKGTIGSQRRRRTSTTP